MTIRWLENIRKAGPMLQLVILLISLPDTLLRAQSPGYLGKKTVFGYGVSVNPAFNAVAKGYGGLLNNQHELFIERAVNKSSVWGFSLKVYQANYHNSGEVAINGNYEPPSGKIAIQGNVFTLYLKKFKANYVAPWGKYVLWALVYTTYTSTYDPEEMTVPVVTSISGTSPVQYTTLRSSKFGPTSKNFQYPDLSIGGGNSRIFKNKFVVDYGYSVNVIAMAMLVTDVFDEYEYMDVYVRKKSALRVRGISRFNFFIKAGYLF